MIAGGASSAPRRWSFPQQDAESLNRTGYSSTARINALMNVKKRIFSAGFLPGSNKF